MVKSIKFQIVILFLLLSLVACKKEEIVAIESYNISGTVLTKDNLGLAGVSVSFSASDSTVTDMNGNWSFTSLSGESAIVASKNGYTFNPGRIAVNTSTPNVVFRAFPIPSSNERKIVNWFNSLQLSNGLLPSSDNYSNVSLYDNALSALVYMSYGEYDRAEKVFDFFNNRIGSELLLGKGGFSQFRDREGVPNGHRWLGDNAWLLIALNNYKSLSGSNKYSALSAGIASWIRSLQDSDGKVWGGFETDDTKISVITEGNIDAFNAISGYSGFHSTLLSFLKKYRWDAQNHDLVAWPGNKYLYALDMHSWGYCAFEDFPVSTLTTADRFVTTKTATVNGKPITGYCFDIDKDVVWLEGTGQMVVAFNQAGLVGQAQFYLSELEKMIIESKTFGNAFGIPYATNPGSSYGDESTMLWVGAESDPIISSGAWYLFAKSKFNPLAIGRHKKIPTVDKFWLK